VLLSGQLTVTGTGPQLVQGAVAQEWLPNVQCPSHPQGWADTYVVLYVGDELFTGSASGSRVLSPGSYTFTLRSHDFTDDCGPGVATTYRDFGFSVWQF
jgi:hypothetical protein